MPSGLIKDLSRTLDDIEVPLDQGPLAGWQEVTTLVEPLAPVPDPRRRQGCRYPSRGLLTVAVMAALCGARPPAGSSRWAQVSDASLLKALGLPQAVDARMPDTTTWGRAPAKTDGDTLDDALTLFTEAPAADPLDEVVDTEVTSPAADGKTVCAAVDADGKQPRLLSFSRSDTGTPTALRAVRDKGCEVTHFAAVLDTSNSVAGPIVTADALHHQRKHTLYLHKRDTSSFPGYWATSSRSTTPSMYSPG